MDAFEYLSVLISIVLGLALTRLLAEAARLIQVRRRVRVYWPVLVWMFSLLLILVQSWWALFDFRDHQGWTLLQFALILAHPTLLYLLCVLLLPDAGTDGEIDLRANYFDQAPWFFASAAAFTIFSALRPLVFDGALPLDADRLFHLGFLAVALLCMVQRNERLHQLAALTVPISVSAYAGLLFFRLT